MKEHRSHNKPVLTGALLRRAAALKSDRSHVVM